MSFVMGGGLGVATRDDDAFVFAPRFLPTSPALRLPPLARLFGSRRCSAARFVCTSLLTDVWRAAADAAPFVITLSYTMYVALDVIDVVRVLRFAALRAGRRASGSIAR